MVVVMVAAASSLSSSVLSSVFLLSHKRSISEKVLWWGKNVSQNFGGCTCFEAPWIWKVGFHMLRDVLSMNSWTCSFLYAVYQS
jgi:hypothetical protein